MQFNFFEEVIFDLRKHQVDGELNVEVSCQRKKDRLEFLPSSNQA